jgi:hypothetical protein
MNIKVNLTEEGAAAFKAVQDKEILKDERCTIGYRSDIRRGMQVPCILFAPTPQKMAMFCFAAGIQGVRAKQKLNTEG